MKSTNEFNHVLQSDGMNAEIRTEADIYGWLNGSWKIRVIDYADDGSWRLGAEFFGVRMEEGK